MVSPHIPGGFGGKLREARERKGITLRQISNATKISVGALEALEQNDIARLPGGIFSRAFVRSYSLEVGLDPEQAIQDFMAQFPNDSVTAGHPTSGRIEDNEELESERLMASTGLRLFAISVVVGGLLVYFMTREARAPEAPAQPSAASTAGSSSPAPDGTSAGNDVTAAAAAKVDPPVAPPVSSQLRVGLSATARCWVSATVDGARVIWRELEPGEKQALQGSQHVVLTVGDAGALSLTINDKPTKPLGMRGQVVTIRVNAGDYEKYLETPR
jgi:cytoskeletal protein RodZ